MKIQIEQIPWLIESRTRDEDRRDMILTYIGDERSTRLVVSSGELYLLKQAIEAMLRFRDQRAS